MTMPFSATSYNCSFLIFVEETRLYETRWLSNKRPIRIGLISDMQQWFLDIEVTENDCSREKYVISIVFITEIDKSPEFIVANSHYDSNDNFNQFIRL